MIEATFLGQTVDLIQTVFLLHKYEMTLRHPISVLFRKYYIFGLDDKSVLDV